MMSQYMTDWREKSTERRMLADNAKALRAMFDRRVEHSRLEEYIQDAEKVDAIRPTHRAYLANLIEKDQLFGSGPFADGYGALIIYEADSPEAAEALLKADPFHAAGVFVRWTIRPWKMVFANPRLLPPGA